MNNLENNISDISNNHYRYLMNLENVNGVGLSYKYINDKNTLEPCLCVLVENKVDSKFLTSNNLIPKTYMGIKTDVTRIGKISLNKNIYGKNISNIKMRPLKGGASIGPIHDDFFGTICCIVKKYISRDNSIEYYILSNNHVLADSNQYPIGTFFMQPSLEHGDVFEDMVATLSDFIPESIIEYNYEPENLVDAAIAEVLNPNMISSEIYTQGKIKGIAEPALLLNVKKVGAKTGLSFGHVRTTNSSIKLNIDENNSLIYKKQILSELKTAPGDSGSAILTNDNKIIGMHMLGSGDGFSIANNINIVLDKLNVELYTD